MTGTLTQETSSKVGGLTLWGPDLPRPSALFFPRSALVDSATIDVVLWFHGFYVSSYRRVFADFSSSDPDRNPDVRLRQSILDSGRDLVLVAPFLGAVPYPPGDAEKKAAVTDDLKAKVDLKSKLFRAGANQYAKVEVDLGSGNACETYLTAVLQAIGDYRAAIKAASAPAATATAPASTPKPAQPVAPQLGNLYLASHSGGGAGMLDVLASLGSAKDKLKECWGFDCIYSADGYVNAARSNPKVKFYLYFGQGSSFTSAFESFSQKYGMGKNRPANGLDNLKIAPATTSKWPGVDDDSRAFAKTADIPPQPAKVQNYETFRRQLDGLDADKKSFAKFLNDNQRALRTHYAVPATLLTPRITQSIPR
ncbi:MAG: hypothetical protein ABJD97_16155 [Betaproteobacteria bacterium]